MEMRAAGRSRRSARSNVVSARSMEAFSPAGDCARGARGRAAGRTIPTTWPFAPQLLVSSWDASRSLSCRALYCEGRPGHLVADTGAAASPRQPDLSSKPVLLGARRGDAARPASWNGMRVDAIEQREDQILATATESGGNATTTIAARYVVGCDGAHSRVRRAIGAVSVQAMRRGGAAGPDFGHPGAQPFGNDAGTGLGD